MNTKGIEDNNTKERKIAPFVHGSSKSFMNICKVGAVDSV